MGLQAVFCTPDPPLSPLLTGAVLSPGWGGGRCLALRSRPSGHPSSRVRPLPARQAEVSVPLTDGRAASVLQSPEAAEGLWVTVAMAFCGAWARDGAP